MSKEGRGWGIDADPLEQPRLVLANQDHHGSGLSSLGFQSFLVSWPYMDLNQHSASARLLRPVAGPGLSVHRNSEDRGADAQSQRHAWSLLLFCSRVLRRPCWQHVYCLSLDSPPCGVTQGLDLSQTCMTGTGLKPQDQDALLTEVNPGGRISRAGCGAGLSASDPSRQGPFQKVVDATS